MSKKSIRIQLETEEEEQLKRDLVSEAGKAGFTFPKGYYLYILRNRHQIKTKEMDKARGEG